MVGLKTGRHFTKSLLKDFLGNHAGHVMRFSRIGIFPIEGRPLGLPEQNVLLGTQRPFSRMRLSAYWDSS
jgi:hypothetical protein